MDNLSKHNYAKKKFSETSAPRYIVITPVKNEQEYIEITIKSMLAQTRKPVKWLIMNDGSTDGTREIVERFAQQHDWIALLNLDSSVDRKPGDGIAKVFNIGYAKIENIKADAIVKLDGDVSFDHDYFESLLQKFEDNPKLGIASGVYFERGRDEWQKRDLIRVSKGRMFHACGASKVYRMECIRDIGGLKPVRGWDTVDEISAQVKGWITQGFPDCRLYHHKREGSGVGLLRTNKMLGEISYTTGSFPPFFLMKCFHRAVCAKPFILGGIWMWLGYMKCMISGTPRIVNRKEHRFYQKQQIERIKSFIRRKDLG